MQGGHIRIYLGMPFLCRKSAIFTFQDSDLRSHVGNNKMLSIMWLQYYWIGMTRDIREYVLSWQMCQKVKPTTGNIVPPLAMTEVTPHPFHNLIIDTVGPLRKSQGYKHFVCVTDQYSKYIITWPTRDVHASSLVRQLHERIICVYGAPRRLLSDYGSAFASSCLRKCARCTALNIALVLAITHRLRVKLSAHWSQWSLSLEHLSMTNKLGTICPIGSLGNKKYIATSCRHQSLHAHFWALAFVPNRYKYTGAIWCPS